MLTFLKLPIWNYLVLKRKDYTICNGKNVLLWSLAIMHGPVWLVGNFWLTGRWIWSIPPTRCSEQNYFRDEVWNKRGRLTLDNLRHIQFVSESSILIGWRGWQQDGEYLTPSMPILNPHPKKMHKAYFWLENFYIVNNRVYYIQSH